MGLKPVYRILPSAQTEWKRLPGEIQYDYIEEGGGPFYISFTFSFIHEESEVAYFAFTYPFGYDEIQRQSEEIVQKYKDSETLYAHKEVLGLSVEGRAMEMLTISNRNKITYEREELIPGLFPDNP